MEISQFAPVLIPTLNRHVHFKRCVESLAQCTHADKTELYIAFDYPLKEEHWEGYNTIKDYLPRIKGFKKVHIIRREENFGPYRNFWDANSDLFEMYDRLIFSEDDNVFSKDFLNFVNMGLTVYASRQDIFSISGYNYPVSIPKNYYDEVYAWQGFSAWGVGIWREKWKKIMLDHDIALVTLRSFLKDYCKVYQHHRVANHYIPNKFVMLRSGHYLGDVYITLFMFLNGMYTIFPVISRVRNTGHDGSGVHCGVMIENTYRNQAVYESKSNYYFPYDIKEVKELNKVLQKHFKQPLKSQIATMIKLFLINLGLLYPNTQTKTNCNIFKD